MAFRRMASVAHQRGSGSINGSHDVLARQGRSMLAGVVRNGDTPRGERSGSRIIGVGRGLGSMARRGDGSIPSTTFTSRFNHGN